ncbi:hypothetical protein BDZ91DRAFT_844272 [Kalaharituber pfeilii]|nr:hypothetical protein BDZ91DRAFT_844272 [Kalaharituber pfeilii]
MGQGCHGGGGLRSPLRLLLVGIQVLALAALVSAGQQPGKGYHSSRFDAKYVLSRDLVVTPETHPHLFRFTGRWDLSGTTYRATTWPGTSVNILVFGNSCSIKLRPRSGLGHVDNYSYYVSVDGSEDYKYSLPAFDTGKGDEGQEVTLLVPIELDLEGYKAKGGKAKRDGTTAQTTKVKEVQTKKTLRPHTIRITSDPHTPFAFESVLTENTLIEQGWAWAASQDERLSIEFIGEGIDAERLGSMGLTGGWTRVPEDPFSTSTTESAKTKLVSTSSLIDTTQYRVGERLSARHWHTSAGVCLVDNCSKSNPLPGLASQYFQRNPFNHTLPVTAKDEITKVDPNFFDIYLFEPRKPRIPAISPTHIVVDLGVADVLVHGVDIKAYKKALTLFLGELRTRAYPRAKILVIGRIDAPGKQSGARATDSGDATPDGEHGHKFHSVIPSIPEMARLRRKLYKANKAAAKLAAELFPPVRGTESTGEVIFVRVQDSGADPGNDLLRGLCTVLPEKYSGVRKACGEMRMLEEKRGWIMDAFWAVLAVAMLTMARETVVGACRVVFVGITGLRTGRGAGARREERGDGLLGSASGAMDKGKGREREGDEEGGKGKLG